MAIEKRVTTKGAKYLVRVWDKALGKRVQVGTFNIKKEAEAAERAAQDALRRVGFVTERKDCTLGGLCEKYADLQTNPRTKAWYQQAFAPAREYFGDTASVRRLSRENMQGYLSELVKQKKAEKTRHVYVKALRTLMNFAIDHQYREDNPVTRLRNSPKDKRKETCVRVISPAEHAVLVASAPTRFRIGRGSKPYDGYRVMFAIWPWVGLRLREMQGLLWRDVDLTNCVLLIRQQLTSGGLERLKTSASRRNVRMSPAVAAELRKWRQACGKSEPDALVFPTPTGKPQTATHQFYKLWDKACVAAGLEGLHPHNMRHTFVSWHMEAGENVRWVAQQAGHTKPSVTLDVYTDTLPVEDGETERRVDKWHAAKCCVDEGTATILPRCEATGS